jgi:hypothetical protein
MRYLIQLTKTEKGRHRQTQRLQLIQFWVLQNRFFDVPGVFLSKGRQHNDKK